MTARGKTTPTSTPGSFRAHTGPKSRAALVDDPAREMGLPSLTHAGNMLGQYKPYHRSDGRRGAFYTPKRGYTIAHFYENADHTWTCELNDTGGMPTSRGVGATPVAAANAAETSRPSGHKMFEPSCEVCCEPTTEGDNQNGQCSACRDAAQETMMGEMTLGEPDDEWEGIPMYFPDGAPAARRNRRTRACWFEDHTCEIRLNDGRSVRIRADFLHDGGWLSGNTIDDAGKPTDTRENLMLTEISAITIV